MQHVCNASSACCRCGCSAPLSDVFCCCPCCTVALQLFGGPARKASCQQLSRGGPACMCSTKVGGGSTCLDAVLMLLHEMLKLAQVELAVSIPSLFSTHPTSYPARMWVCQSNRSWFITHCVPPSCSFETPCLSTTVWIRELLRVNSRLRNRGAGACSHHLKPGTKPSTRKAKLRM